jgi:hypothetical protein
MEVGIPESRDDDGSRVPLLDDGTGEILVLAHCPHDASVNEHSVSETTGCRAYRIGDDELAAHVR